MDDYLSPIISVKHSDAISEASSVTSAVKLPPLLSLFSGAGGLDLGFHQAGFQTALALDIDKSAIESFNKNIEPEVGIVADLCAIKAQGVLELLKTRIPVGSSIGIIGGPPCQGFSVANPKSLVDDPRNQLPFVYLSIVSLLSKNYDIPFIVLENVAGIRSSKHAVTYQKLLTRIKNLGYYLNEFVLDASAFGVPQVRKRVLLVGIKKVKGQKEKTIKLSPSNEVITVREAIGQLGEPTFFSKNLDSKDFPHHHNHWTMKPKSEKFRNTSTATGRSFRRIEWDKPSKTIAFGHREILVHPSGTRRLSIYEAMLLQGFPENFRLYGTLSAQVTQVSNAVPPPLAKAIASSLLPILTA